MSHNATSEGRGGLAQLVRSVYLERKSGVVEVTGTTGTSHLFFRRGELHIDRDDELAQRLVPILAEVREGRAAANPELCQAVEELARRFAADRQTRGELKSDLSVVVELIGPLPTVCFLPELAVYGSHESELFTLLGGEQVKLRSTDQTPALQQLPRLAPEMAQGLVGLEQPATPADLMRGAGSDRLKLLRGLVKLWAVGLVSESAATDRSYSPMGTGEVLTLKLLDRFKLRLAEDLEARPLDLPVDEHRTRIAEMLSRLGKLNHYQLLGVAPDAQGDDVFVAYSQLGRRVHPTHAERLGMADKDEVLQVLFERATEAYLTLSDPRRRSSYNTVAGIHVNVQIDPAQRGEEKRRVARELYRRAVSCISEMDYSLAVDLLKEASRIDPKPEYYARLGLAQSKNPRWQRHAVESYRRAVQLQPGDAGLLTGYGLVLEEMERFDEAREQFKAALEAMPDHPEARSALERLGGSGLLGKAQSGGGFRTLFGKPKG